MNIDVSNCPAIYPLTANQPHCNCEYTDKKKTSIMVLGKTKHNTTFHSNQSRFGRNTNGRWNTSLTNTKMHPIISDCSGNIIQSGNIFKNTHSMSKKQRLASLMKRGGKRYRR